MDQYFWWSPYDIYPSGATRFDTPEAIRAYSYLRDRDERSHNNSLLCNAKSGADEGYWAEMSAIYINHQHLRGFYTKENCGNARLDHVNSYQFRP